MTCLTMLATHSGRFGLDDDLDTDSDDQDTDDGECQGGGDGPCLSASSSAVSERGPKLHVPPCLDSNTTLAHSGK